MWTRLKPTSVGNLMCPSALIRPKLWISKILGIFHGKEIGTSLIETIIGLAVLGTICTAYLGGVATAFEVEIVSHESVVAESLVKSQLEHIKRQNYIATAEYNPSDSEKSYELIDIPDDLVGQGYAIEISHPITVASPVGDDSFALQCVTVVVKRNAETILTTSDYKVGRVR